MPAYQQMGHQSENLLSEPNLSSYRGAILSPVNYTEAELVDISTKAKFHGGFDVIFDPQLYLPRTQQRTLRGWSYLPDDFESSDATDDAWWAGLVDKLVGATARVKPDALCSPVVLPREFAPEYFEQSVATAAQLVTRLEKSSTRAIQSTVVGLDYLTAPGRAMGTASILTRTACEEIYLVFLGDDVPPRRELSDPEQLKGAMTLIAALERADVRVIVAFSSSDMLLWKAAGATHCATGKFFNVRRFSRARFEEPPAKGGGQLPYWFEESLMAFLRPTDLVRVRPHGMVSRTAETNPYAREILKLLDTTPEAAWVALGWKEFLYWFSQAERRMAAGEINLDALLESAEDNWAKLQQARPKVLMEEPANAGAWIRQWRRAVLEYPFSAGGEALGR